MSKKPLIPSSPEALAPAAQALTVAGADADIRALAERALRRAVEMQQEDVCALSAQPTWKHRNNANPLPMRDGQALSGAELNAWIQNSNNHAALHSVYRGIAYLFKQRELQDMGISLSAWMDEQGLQRRRVYEEIKVARMFASLPDGAAHLSVQLNPRKQVDLAALPLPIIERMAIDGTLESMSEMTDRQAKEVIAHRKTMEKKLDQANRDKAALEQENHALKARDGWKGDLPQAVQQARVEGSALTLEALDCVTRLDAFVRTLSTGVGLHAESDRRQAELRAGLGPLAAQLLAIRTQADAALQSLQDTMGDYIPVQQPLLSESEALDARERFTFMLGSQGRLPLEAKASASQGGKRK